MRVAVVVVVAGLAGCAGDTALRADIGRAQIEWSKAQAEIQKQPLVDIRFHPNGQVERIVMRQAQGGGGGYQGPQLPDDPAFRVLDRAVGVLGTVGGIWAGGWAAGNIVESVAGMGVGMVRELGNPQPNLTTIYRDNRYSSDDISGSFNPWTNSGRVGSPDDYTAPPLVVEQPRPVIVTQPAPVVVP